MSANLVGVTKNERVGLVLSGGGSRGAYHIGVLQCLAKRNVKIDVVSGASIGALNGAFVAAETNLGVAAEKLHKIWNLLADDGPSKLEINVSKFIAVKLINELIATLCDVQLSDISHLFNVPPERIGLLEQGYIRTLLTRHVSPGSLMKGLPLYISVYNTRGALNDISSVIWATLNIKNTPSSEFLHVQSIDSAKQIDMILASAALPLIFEAKHGFADGGMGSFLDSQGNTPAYPLIHEEKCSHIIVTHLDNGSFWDRYKYDTSSTTLLEIRPQKSLNQQGWKDVINFDPQSIKFWIDQGYEDTERCLDKIRTPILLHPIAQETQNLKKQALEILENDDFRVD